MFSSSSLGTWNGNSMKLWDMAMNQPWFSTKTKKADAEFEVRILADSVVNCDNHLKYGCQTFQKMTQPIFWISLISALCECIPRHSAFQMSKNPLKLQVWSPRVLHILLLISSPNPPEGRHANKCSGKTSTAISGTDSLEVPTIYKAYVRSM